MYPLKQEQAYPFEHWWIAAQSSEVGRKILGRTILNQRVVLFRTNDGAAVALAGHCPHRNYPFEKSELVGDALQCGYHGFTFDRAGSCIAIPSQGAVPPHAAVRRYPLVERGGVIWIWTGTAHTADAQLLPNLDDIGLGGAGWALEHHPMVTIKSRYTLLIDNLLDLNHVTFIHKDTIPGAKAIVHIPVEIVETDQSLNARRVGRDLPGNPLLRQQFPDYDGNVDQHFDAEYYGPSLIRTGGTIYAAGTSRALGIQNFIHGITPETPTSLHYFVVTARNFGLDNPKLGAMNIGMGAKIQPQDIEAIEAIEQALQLQPDMPHEISCRGDAAALKVRHRLDTHIRNETRRMAASG